jgi:hypothetical protein
MKKQLFLLTMLMGLTAFQSFADSKTEDVLKTFRFGLFAGPTFNSLRPVAATSDGYNVEKLGGRVGFSFGIMADYNLTDRYQLFSGLGLDWRGGHINALLPDSTSPKNGFIRGADVKYRTQYLTIPFGIKMTAAKFDNIKIQALAAFDLGLLLSQKGDYQFTTNTKDSATNKYIKSNLMERAKLGGYATVVPVALGWSLGVGGEYDLNGSNAVIVQLVYRNGFVDATTPQTNSDGNRFRDGNIRSNSFDIRFGYTF